MEEERSLVSRGGGNGSLSSAIPESWFAAHECPPSEHWVSMLVQTEALMNFLVMTRDRQPASTGVGQAFEYGKMDADGMSPVLYPSIGSTPEIRKWRQKIENANNEVKVFLSTGKQEKCSMVPDVDGTTLLYLAQSRIQTAGTPQKRGCWTSFPQTSDRGH